MELYSFYFKKDKMCFSFETIWYTNFNFYAPSNVEAARGEAYTS